MRAVATVLYEDSMLPGAGGQYPMHDLVMRMVEDEINGLTWKLRPLVGGVPRKGVGNVIKDVKDTSLFAGSGLLCLLVDRDQITAHLKLKFAASDDEITKALEERSDAKDKLRTFFLLPNLEGLLKALQACEPSLLPASVASALDKKLTDRDIVLVELGKAARRSVRDCVREAQPGLDALVKALAALIPPGAISTSVVNP